MRRFSSFLCGFVCCLLICGLCVSAFAEDIIPDEPLAGDAPSGSVYSGPMSYTSSVVSSYDYWKATSNSLAGIWYKLGSTTQSGSVIYLLNSIYNKIPSSSGGSGSSAWTSSQASNIVSYTYDIKNALGYSSTSTLASKLTSIDTHIQAISSPTVNTGWTSTQASSVVSNTQSIVSKLTNIDGSTDGLESKLDLIYSGAILNYYPDFATYLSNLDGIGPKIDSVDSNVQLNTQTLSDFFTYFSESSSPVTFRYHYRSTPGNALSRSSSTDQIAYLTASSGSRKVVETLSSDSLSFFDRLTLLNNNLVSTATLLATPSSQYSFTLTNYETDVSQDFSLVSIADLLYYLNRGIVDSVRRLAFMSADDDDIAIKRDTQAQRDYIADQYAENGSAPSADDMGVVNDSVGSVLDSFSTGQSESFSTYYSDAQNRGYSFWSQAVYEQLVPLSTRSSSSPLFFEGDYVLTVPDIWGDFNG